MLRAITARAISGNNLLAKQLDSTGKQHQAQAKEDKTERVEATSWRGEIRHVLASVDDSDNADGNINQEYPVPACPGHQYAAEHGAEDRADQAGMVTKLSTGSSSLRG